MSRDWSSGLFECFNPFPICLLGTFCPCILYGQVSDKNNDPRSEPSGINGTCCGWYALSCCGLQCLLQMGTRREIRSKYQIQGSGSTDFLISWCCFCCGLVQEYKELENVEKNGGGVGMGGAVQQGYVAPQQSGGMTYAAPAQGGGMAYAAPAQGGGMAYAAPAQGGGMAYTAPAQGGKEM